MMFISLEHLQKFASVVGGYILCPECARQYEPALTVELRGEKVEGRKVMHFAPVPYVFSNADVSRGYQPSFCKPLPRGLLKWYEDAPALGVHSYFFLRDLVRRYPELIDRPLTERVLREVGCDIEAELAMWQLGNK
jgi:hypothetical protein